MSINEKIEALRNQMRFHQIDAVIIPSSDPHQSEYVAEHWKSREWISGFTGSAGTAVVTLDHAGVWTDSRYFIQGEQELADSDFVLHKLVNQGHAEYAHFLVEHLKDGATIAGDGNVFSMGLHKHLKSVFENAGMQLETKLDLIQEVWKDRPALPSNKIFQHDIKYAGKTSSEKIGEIRAAMDEHGADYHLISTLDDIAWTLNIRGSDV
ncbi:MAG: aminopeptidase P family N-terminal domain-containing protein, partial [Bacteroidota bacterium]